MRNGPYGLLPVCSGLLRCVLQCRNPSGSLCSPAAWCFRCSALHRDTQLHKYLRLNTKFDCAPPVMGCENFNCMFPYVVLKGTATVKISHFTVDHLARGSMKNAANCASEYVTTNSWVGSVACYKTTQWSLASLPCSTHRSE